MRRTRHRPLPSHAVSPRAALVFGIVLGVVSFAWLTLTVNLLAALLALPAPSPSTSSSTRSGSSARRRRTSSSAGRPARVPVLVGWAAVTGRSGVPALVLFAIVFYWTPPHFWALALRYASDYAAARVPMLPVVRGEAETARQIVLYTLLLVAVSLLLFPAGADGTRSTSCAAVVLGAAFVVVCAAHPPRCRRRAGRDRALPLLDQLPDAALRRRSRPTRSLRLPSAEAHAHSSRVEPCVERAPSDGHPRSASRRHDHADHGRQERDVAEDPHQRSRRACWSSSGVGPHVRTIVR